MTYFKPKCIFIQFTFYIKVVFIFTQLIFYKDDVFISEVFNIEIGNFINY